MTPEESARECVADYFSGAGKVRLPELEQKIAALIRSERARAAGIVRRYDGPPSTRAVTLDIIARAIEQEG